MLNRTPKTDLTLSAAPGLRHEVGRTPAAIHRTAICSDCGRAIFRVGSGWLHVITAGHDAMPEAELRALWGDR
jgi:hypothetical protein